MPHIHLINASKPLVMALEAYHKFLKLPYDFQEHEKGTNLSLDNLDIILVHNKDPESLGALFYIKKLREVCEQASIPILWLSEKLSRDAQFLLDEVEFVFPATLPFDSGQFFEEVDAIVQYIKDSIEVLEQRVKIAHLLVASKWQEALDLIKSIEPSLDNRLKLEILYGTCYAGLEEFETAIGHAEKAVDLNDRSMEAQTLLASLYKKVGEEERAAEVLANTTAIAEIHMENLIHWGDVYMDRGDPNKAARAYKGAGEIDDKEMRAREGLFAANLMSGKSHLIQQAQENLPQGMDVARFCNLRGIAMANAGNYKMAEILYHNAVKFVPKNRAVVHKLWMNLGLCMKKQGKYKEALIYFNKAKDAAPPEYDRVDDQIRACSRLLEKQQQGDD